MKRNRSYYSFSIQSQFFPSSASATPQHLPRKAGRLYLDGIGVEADEERRRLYSDGIGVEADEEKERLDIFHMDLPNNPRRNKNKQFSAF